MPANPPIWCCVSSHWLLTGEWQAYRWSVSLFITDSGPKAGPLPTNCYHRHTRHWLRVLLVCVDLWSLCTSFWRWSHPFTRILNRRWPSSLAPFATNLRVKTQAVRHLIWTNVRKSRGRGCFANKAFQLCWYWCQYWSEALSVCVCVSWGLFHSISKLLSGCCSCLIFHHHQLMSPSFLEGRSNRRSRG